MWEGGATTYGIQHNNNNNRNLPDRCGLNAISNGKVATGQDVLSRKSNLQFLGRMLWNTKHHNIARHNKNTIHHNTEKQKADENKAQVDRGGEAGVE